MAFGRDHHPGTGNTETGNTETGNTGTCEVQLAIEAEQATSAMDMTSYMLLNQTMSTAKEAVSAGGASGKKMYQLDGMAKGTLSTIAAGKYAKCTAAISACETACSLCDDKIGRIVPSGENLPDGIDDKDGINCKTKTTILNRCTAQQTLCSQNALQAAMSTLQAATSFIGAKALDGGGDGDGDGDSDENKPTGPPDLPNLANNPDINSSCPGCFGDPKGDEGPIAPPDDNPDETILGSETEENPDTENPNADPTESSPGPMLSTSPSSGSRGKGTANGMYAGSASDGQALAPDFIEDEEWEDEEEEDQRKGSRYASAPGSDFAGSGHSSGYKWGSDSSYRGRSGSGSRGLGALKKKGEKESKRNVFSKSGEQDNIFKKMSRLIQSYCNKGGEQC